MTNKTKNILIDGRFIGVGDSMTRYTLEITKHILAMDQNNNYTILVRPQGVKIAKQFLISQISNVKPQTCTSKLNNNSRIGNWKLEIGNLALEVLDIPHYSLSEQTKLLKWLNKMKYDLVHFTQFNHPIKYKGKFVVTVHDLTLLGHLYRMNPLKRIGFRMVMASAVKNSSKIITISNTSKNDIVDTYNCDPKKIEVIYIGVEDNFNSKIKNQKSKLLNFKSNYKIKDDYILYTGMWKRHKNLLRMLKAFEQVMSQTYNLQTKELKNLSTSLETGSMTKEQKDCHCEESGSLNSSGQAPQSNIQLVLVGKIDKDEPEIISEINRINSACHSRPVSKHGINSSGNLMSASFPPRVKARGKLRRESTNSQSILVDPRVKPEDDNPKKLIPNAYLPIVTTGFIEENELPVAYAGALLYCIPSLSEGFGLPPIEAMACGTPVVSSNISAMPEILGNAPLYFDPYDISDIANKMKRVINDKNLQAKLSKKGLEQAKRYDWKNTAKQTLDVYKKVLES